MQISINCKLCVKFDSCLNSLISKGLDIGMMQFQQFRQVKFDLVHMPVYMHMK